MIALPNVEAIAWDLDGTLIDSFQVYTKIAHDLSAKFGLRLPSRQEMLENYHGSLEETLRKTFYITSDGTLQKVMAEFMALQETYYRKGVNGHFYEDALTLANQADQRGLKQIIVTNRAHEGRQSASPHSIIGRSKIRDFIHEIRCRDQVEYGKPDARVMHDWLVTHDFHPDKVLVVGDQHVDAQLAINLKARAVLISRNGEIPHLDSLENKQPDKIFIVDSLHDVTLA